MAGYLWRLAPGCAHPTIAVGCLGRPEPGYAAARQAVSSRIIPAPTTEASGRGSPSMAGTTNYSEILVHQVPVLGAQPPSTHDTSISPASLPVESHFHPDSPSNVRRPSPWR